MRLALLCVIFLFSGAAGLLFETLWFRGAGLSFGNSVWASAITLAAYMGGLALGNLLTWRFGRRIRQPVRAYAVLELVIAVAGLLLVALLPAMAGVVAPLLGPIAGDAWWTSPIRVLLVFGLLMIPTTAMGATLPLLVMALCRVNTGFGKALGFLYGFNTLGAMVGAVAGELFLIESFGILGTGAGAALLNVLAAVLSFALLRQWDEVASTDSPVSASLQPGASFNWRVKVMLLAGCLAGAALLGAEVIWFRFLRLFFLDTDATFVVMLAVVLAGIALGGLLAGALLSRWPQRHDLALPCAAICALVFMLCYSLFDARLGGDNWYTDSGAIAKLSILLMFPTSLASGALFIFLGQAIHVATGTDVEAAAALTTANTTGAMLGALLAAFVLLPGAGIEGALWALALLYGVIAACLMLAQPRPRRLVLTLLALALLLPLGWFPFGNMKAHLDTSTEKFRTTESSHTVAVHEGLTETIQYLRRDWLGQPLFHRLMTNGFSMSDTQAGSRRYMGLYAYWPAAVHPSLQSALLISYGVGNTAKSLTQIPSLKEIHVVDISRDIIQLATVPYPGATSPLTDPRVRVHIDDGRYYLQATAQRFDLITSEPPPPRAPGVISLYTQEYFELIRNRLNDGGIATYWLPVHNMSAADARSIIKGFCNAFEDCGLWEGFGLNWMLTGSRHAKVAASAEHFTAQWRDPALASTLAELGLERPELLGTTFMADAEQLQSLLGDTRPLTDNYPKRYSQRFPDEADNRFYGDWMNVRKTAERFQSSRWVARFWPPALREASAGYFWLHQGINLPLEIASASLSLQMISDILDKSELQTPIYWLLGSSVREAELARRAPASGQHPGLAYVLGADALARRQFNLAANQFEAALLTGDRRALAPLLFSACRATQIERARQWAATYGQGLAPSRFTHCW
jgi:spermidine synthase